MPCMTDPKEKDHKVIKSVNLEIRYTDSNIGSAISQMGKSVSICFPHSAHLQNGDTTHAIVTARFIPSNNNSGN